jgi:hypothetical protein
MSHFIENCRCVRCKTAQPEHDAEAIVSDIAGALADGIGVGRGTVAYHCIAGAVAEAVQAGREPLLKRIEDMRAGWVAASNREIAMAEHESRQAQRIEELEQALRDVRVLIQPVQDAVRAAGSALTRYRESHTRPSDGTQAPGFLDAVIADAKTEGYREGRADGRVADLQLKVAHADGKAQGAREAYDTVVRRLQEWHPDSAAIEGPFILRQAVIDAVVRARGDK